MNKEHFDLLIILDNLSILDDINLNQLNLNIKVLDNSVKTIDDNSIEYNGNIIYFDYLLTNDSNLLKILDIIFDNGFALTNSSFQTIKENIFAFGKAINSNLDISEQIKIIIETIKE